MNTSRRMPRRTRREGPPRWRSWTSGRSQPGSCLSAQRWSPSGKGRVLETGSLTYRLAFGVLATYEVECTRSPPTITTTDSAFCYGHQRGVTTRVVERVVRSPVGVYGLFALPFLTLGMEKSVYDTVQSWQGIDPNVRPADRGGFPSGGASEFSMFVFSPCMCSL